MKLTQLYPFSPGLSRREIFSKAENWGLTSGEVLAIIIKQSFPGAVIRGCAGTGRQASLRCWCQFRRVGSSPVSRTNFLLKDCTCARVVELADSLDSGSSVLYGRAGSSPASRTIPKNGFRHRRRNPFFGHLAWTQIVRNGFVRFRDFACTPRWRRRTGFLSTVYRYARVVELADSLDSGSSVLYGRAGSSPASRTKRKRQAVPVSFFWCFPAFANGKMGRCVAVSGSAALRIRRAPCGYCGGMIQIVQENPDGFPAHTLSLRNL